MTVVLATPVAGLYRPVPLHGLAGGEPADFALYLRTADDVWVLYRGVGEALDEDHLGRLAAEGIGQLFVRSEDAPRYFARIETSIEELLRHRHTPLPGRAAILHGVATHVAEQLMAGVPDPAMLQRANRVMLSTCGLLQRESGALAALRRSLARDRRLAAHSLTVAMVSMGLARYAISADATVMVEAGLAGLLHDVGRIGYTDLDHDPEHPERGADLLAKLQMPTSVVDAARWHHERWDGSGYPHGLRGGRIPEMARVVGLVNTFHKVYEAQAGKAGVYDALRIVAQAYRGCFEERLAVALVQTFQAGK
ncbi:MAG: hypothetical protein RL398_3616 [Planctomycetota bacterium]|jgi:putative nucleotidyltransferase with HDIG domain